MPYRLFGVFMLLLVFRSLAWAQGEVVLLTVGNEKITKGEFEYHFNKSKEKRVDVFVETFIRFKQKVLSARSLQLDTLTAFRMQRDAYVQEIKQSASAFAVDSENVEWIKIEYLSYPLRQSSDKEEQQMGSLKMDSLYANLKNGVRMPFKELPWMQTRHLLNEWQQQLANLTEGEYSKPFFSPLGIHIVSWKQKTLGNSSLQKMWEKYATCRVKEMEEALLVVALEDYLEENVICTESDLKNHFKKHRSDYGGGIPHFKGTVIHCKNKREAKAIKKYLKNISDNQCEEAVKLIHKDGVGEFRLETGLFPIGVNPYVDKLAFKCGDFKPLADYPYTCILGRKLKKGPTDYQDVRIKVEKDCREEKKMTEIEALTRKYKVEIDKEVLKTVNRAENK